MKGLCEPSTQKKMWHEGDFTHQTSWFISIRLVDGCCSSPSSHTIQFSVFLPHSCRYCCCCYFMWRLFKTLCHGDRQLAAYFNILFFIRRFYRWITPHNLIKYLAHFIEYLVSFAIYNRIRFIVGASFRMKMFICISCDWIFGSSKALTTYESNNARFFMAIFDM